MHQLKGTSHELGGYPSRGDMCLGPEAKEQEEDIVFLHTTARNPTGEVAFPVPQL